MYSWFDTWSVRYNVLWSLTDVLLGFCGNPGCILVTACPFFQEESQLLSLQCYQNQSCHSWLRQKCPDTCNCIFFVLSITLSLCSRFISFRVTIITLFILKCQGFISVLQKFIICFSMQSFVQFTITSFWFKKFFIKITFYLLLQN